MYNLFLEKFFKLQLTNKVYRVCDFFFFEYLKNREYRALKDRKFIYDILTLQVYKKQKFLKQEFSSLRLVKLYYIYLTYKDLKLLAKKAQRMDGVFESNYFYLLECRLPSLIYRSGLISNMFESLLFVKGNNVWVNKVFRSEIYYSVKCMIPVGVRILSKGYLFWMLYKRIIRKALMFKRSNFLFFSYHFFIFFLLRRPRQKDLIYPFDLDIFRVSSFAV